MIGRLIEAQHKLHDLRVIVEADMPKAEDALAKGDEQPFLKVTGTLKRVVELEQIVEDLIAVEVGATAWSVQGVE